MHKTRINKKQIAVTTLLPILIVVLVLGITTTASTEISTASTNTHHGKKRATQKAADFLFKVKHRLKPKLRPAYLPDDGSVVPLDVNDHLARSLPKDHKRACLECHGRGTKTTVEPARADFPKTKNIYIGRSIVRNDAPSGRVTSRVMIDLCDTCGGTGLRKIVNDWHKKGKSKTGELQDAERAARVKSTDKRYYTNVFSFTPIVVYSYTKIGSINDPNFLPLANIDRSYGPATHVSKTFFCKAGFDKSVRANYRKDLKRIDNNYRFYNNRVKALKKIKNPSKKQRIALRKAMEKRGLYDEISKTNLDRKHLGNPDKFGLLGCQKTVKYQMYKKNKKGKLVKFGRSVTVPFEYSQ